MNVGLEYYQAHTNSQQPWGWIADTRRMSATPSEVQQWLAQDWNLRAYRTGLRKISIVSAQDSSSKLAIQQYAQLAVAQHKKYMLVPEYYPSLEEAKQGVQQRLATLKTRP